MVSRTMRALADDGLVAIGSDPRDARLRLARLPEPARLLDAFERAVALRRPRRVTWEIGARDALEAMKAAPDSGPQTQRAVRGRRGGRSLVRSPRGRARRRGRLDPARRC